VQVLHIHPTCLYDFFDVGLSSSGPLPNLAHMEIMRVPHFMHTGRIFPAMLRARMGDV